MARYICSVEIEAKNKDDVYIELMDIDGHEVDWTIEKVET